MQVTSKDSAGLFHENHAPTILAFGSLNQATYAAEVHWYICLLCKKSANYPYHIYKTFF